ncbi:MAG TPA: transposase, partial [Candidatus Nitrosotalea sp.]|nr:transposase [Candidatus Nitrosotalea sp.]
MRIKERYELAAELKVRYLAAGRQERSEILDAFCLATGYERKHGIRVLGGRKRLPLRGLRRRRKARYGLEFQAALKILWETAGYICSDRLQPFLPDLIPLLERHGQLKIDPSTRELLCSASLSTIERNLVPMRRGLITRKLSQTRPGALLRRQVPVIVGRWRELDRPGYL